MDINFGKAVNNTKIFQHLADYGNTVSLMPCIDFTPPGMHKRMHTALFFVRRAVLPDLVHLHNVIRLATKTVGVHHNSDHILPPSIQF